VSGSTAMGLLPIGKDTWQSQQEGSTLLTSFHRTFNCTERAHYPDDSNFEFRISFDPHIAEW
jgi:hypothetical protein